MKEEAEPVARGGGAFAEGGSVPRVGLVAVGDELLLGQTVDTNAAWLGRELSLLGFHVERRWTVGDVASEIRWAVRAALDAADVVLVTGGLGPTADDRTRGAVADLLGRRNEIDPSLLAALERRFREHGYGELPAHNRSQAEVPEGAVILRNPRGTAPGLLLEETGKPVVLLPGVPAEMKGIWEEELADRLRERFGARLRPVRHRVLHTTGIAESVLSERVEEVLPGDTGPVSLAFLPDVTGVDLRLTVRGVDDAEEAERRLDRVQEALAPAVERYRYRADRTGDLVEAVADALRGRGLTLAAAESCTGGLLAKRITDHAGSSAYFLGGVVAYSDQVKEEVLGVPREVLAARGAVSGDVAGEMAAGVARRLGADAGIGITGIAGPEGGTGEKPVGTVWYAASVGDRVEVRCHRFPGDRDSVRQRSVQAALALLLRLVEGAE